MMGVLRLVLVASLSLACASCTTDREAGPKARPCSPAELYDQLRDLDRCAVVYQQGREAQVAKNPNFAAGLKRLLLSGEVADVGYPQHESVQSFATIKDDSNVLILLMYILELKWDAMDQSLVYVSVPKRAMTHSFVLSRGRVRGFLKSLVWEQPP